MTIQVSCQDCGMAYEVPDEKAGKKFRCKQCQAIVSIPEGDKPSGGSGAWDEDDDPYGDDDGIPNPVSRRRSGSSRSGNRRRRSRSSGGGDGTTAPAIALYVVAGLSIVWWLFFMFTILISDPGDAPPDMSHEEYMTINFVFGGLQILIHGLILFGAYQLHSRQSKAMAMTAAIICCIPCCSPCMIIGIPFGIWALVAISSDPDFT
ncbi:MAG: hypothetical protein KDA66_01100 [Planctomycetaceae bacterium]|nr:hypothetical protein [Planctomycetaceae bacterium]